MAAARSSAACRRSRCSTGPPSTPPIPASYSWERASAARDYMVNRAADAAEPDDSSHVKRLEDVGAVCYRGSARIVGRGRVEIRHDEPAHEIAGRNVMVAVGSTSKVPPLPGLDGVRIWTNREATLARELPRSLARPRRRPDRLRARPGLRPVRRPGHDRPVGRPADADRAPAQLRGGREAPPPRRRRRPARRPGDRGPGRRRRRTAPT